jgi:hypothetical protein
MVYAVGLNIYADCYRFRYTHFLSLPTKNHAGNIHVTGYLVDKILGSKADMG